MTYVGRFAPSPTGPLHLGSLFAAVASWLDARSVGGTWLVRIEDLDPPREQSGASELIIETLNNYGLIADQPIVHQSQRHEAYQDALQTLQRSGDLFWCRCSRKQLAGFTEYPGTCFSHQTPRSDSAAKFKVTQAIEFMDRLQGRQYYSHTEPFVVQRRDLFWAYQLAVVVDDAQAGVTDVVRGIDLIDSTPMQIALHKSLAIPVPNYAHLPVIVNQDGSKLSKQNLATPIALHNKEAVLADVLRRLGIKAGGRTVEAMLNNAVSQWDIEALVAQRSQSL